MYWNATLLAVVYGAIMWANVGAPSWRSAASTDVVDLAAGVGATALVWMVLREIRRSADGMVAERREPLPQMGTSSVGLGPDERAIWLRRLRVPSPLGLLPFVTVLLVGAPRNDVIVVVATLLAYIAWVANTSHVRVLVTGAGVTVTLEGRGRRYFIPLEEILGADAEWIPPEAFDGKLHVGPRGADDYRLHVVGSAGDALRLSTTTGQVLVSVPNAPQAAGLVNDLVRRGRPA